MPGIKKTTAGFTGASSNGRVYSSAGSYDPYLEQASQLKQSNWDKIANFFGFKSSYDKQQEDLAMQSKLRTDQLRMLEDESSYNSEAEKAARMRDAGINPDLQGIQGASEAPGYTEPETTPSSFNYSNSDAFGTLTGVLDLGLSLFKGFTEVRGAMIDNGIKSAQRYGTIADLAHEVVNNSLLPPGLEGFFVNPESGNKEWQMISGNNLDYDALVKQYGKENIRYTVPNFNLPDFKFARGKDQRIFDRELKRFRSSIGADSNRYKEYYDFLSAKRDAAKESSQPYMSPSFEQMQGVFKPINDLVFKVFKLNEEYESSSLSNSIAYEQNYDAPGAAENDNAANRSGKELSEYNEKLNASWNEAAEAIKKLGDKNPVVGMIGMVLLNYLRSNMPMPGILQSRRQTNNHYHTGNTYEEKNVVINNQNQE